MLLSPPGSCYTQSGKIELTADFLLEDIAKLAAEEDNPLADNELLLIGRRNIRSNNSWMHNYKRLVKCKPRWQLLMHPSDLAVHNLQDHSQVKVQSRVGEVITQVLASDEVMPGVVSLPHLMGWRLEYWLCNPCPAKFVISYSCKAYQMRDLGVRFLL